MEGDRKQYPEGFFVSFGLALGMVAGLLFSVILHNPDFFVIGLPVGLALGAAVELKYRKEGRIRPLTPEETKRRTIMVIAAVALVIAGIIVFLVFP
jgi:uncharacterized membrane protein YidH (DUF202 family)